MCVVSPYIPSASVSDGPKDQHCLLYLAVLAGILVVMTTNPRISMGRRIKKYLYNIKILTRKNRNKTICNCKHIMTV